LLTKYPIPNTRKMTEMTTQKPDNRQPVDVHDQLVNAIGKVAEVNDISLRQLRQQLITIVNGLTNLVD